MISCIWLCYHGFSTMMDYIIELHSIATHNCHLNSPFRLTLLILSHRHRRDRPIQRSTTMRIFGLYTVQDADPWLHKSSQSIPGQVSSIIIMSAATFIIFTISNISTAWPNEEVHCNQWVKEAKIISSLYSVHCQKLASCIQNCPSLLFWASIYGIIPASVPWLCKECALRKTTLLFQSLAAFHVIS